MNLHSIGYTALACIASLALCAEAQAQQTVYKWIDEDGEVHFSDAPPPGADPSESETFTTAKSPAPPAPKPVADAPTTTDLTPASQPTVPDEDAPVLYAVTNVSKLSLDDLDLRCDEAREAMIAPIREAEIAKCEEDQPEDPAFCERFYADLGEGGRTVAGAMRPRMFDDLPQCVDALNERNRRGR